MNIKKILSIAFLGISINSVSAHNNADKTPCAAPQELPAEQIGQETILQDIEAKHYWVRAAGEGQNTAAYIALKVGSPNKLIKATCIQAEEVQLHETVQEGAISKMRQLPQVSLSTKKWTEFEPGGKHLMLLRLKGNISELADIKITLYFEQGEVLTLPFPVRAPSYNSKPCLDKECPEPCPGKALNDKPCCQEKAAS